MTMHTVDVIAEIYPKPKNVLTNEEYLTFVVNRAAESYQSQYGAASKEDGITAAREAYNASLPPAPAPEPEPGE